ncbi:MAG: polysaccharide deacetylase family protein [Eubacterium sp.]
MKTRKKRMIVLAIMILCIGAFSFCGYTLTHAGEATGTVGSYSTNSQTANDSVTSQTCNPVKSITLNRSVLNITKGKKGVLSADIQYGSFKDLQNETVVWSSKNTDIATVSKNGIIKAVNIGKTYIICSSQSGLVKARCKVVVREPYNSVKSIKLDKTQIRLNKGDKRTLTPTITYGSKKTYTAEPVSWKSSNNKIATVNKKGVVKGKSNGTTYVTIKSNFTNKSVKCKVIVQKTKYVAFTFDDGPGIYTNNLLDSLEKYHCQATFFVLGNRVNSYKNELKRAYKLGMEIGSHTYSHKNLKTLSKSDIKSEITKTNKAVSDIIGAKPTLLRPPYGNYNKTVSKNAGVPMIYWTVDTLDWKYKKTKYVCDTILKQTKDSEIILLHDIHETTVKGFTKALPKLRKKGFELVTVSELYSIKGKKLKKGVMYYGPEND